MAIDKLRNSNIDSLLCYSYLTFRSLRYQKIAAESLTKQKKELVKFPLSPQDLRKCLFFSSTCRGIMQSRVRIPADGIIPTIRE